MPILHPTPTIHGLGGPLGSIVGAGEGKSGEGTLVVARPMSTPISLFERYCAVAMPSPLHHNTF